MDNKLDPFPIVEVDTTNPYENALNAWSGASNAIGIIKSLALDMQFLADNMRASDDYSTDKLNKHPVLRLYLEQLVWLNTSTMITVEAKPDTMEVAQLCRQGSAQIRGKIADTRRAILEQYMTEIERPEVTEYLCRWANEFGIKLNGEKARVESLGPDSHLEVTAAKQSLAIDRLALFHMVAFHDGEISMDCGADGIHKAEGCEAEKEIVHADMSEDNDSIKSACGMVVKERTREGHSFVYHEAYGKYQLGPNERRCGFCVMALAKKEVVAHE
jgi:hypothetical protein